MNERFFTDPIPIMRKTSSNLYPRFLCSKNKKSRNKIQFGTCLRISLSHKEKFPEKSRKGKFFQGKRILKGKFLNWEIICCVCAGEPSHGTTGSLPPFPAFPFPFPGLPPLPGLFPFEPPQPAFSQAHQHQPANRKNACEADFQPKFPEFLIPGMPTPALFQVRLRLLLLVK